MKSSLVLQDLLLEINYVKQLRNLTKFKCQQNLWIYITKNDDIFKNKFFADLCFDSEEIEFSGINIDQLFDIQHNQLLSRVETWTYDGSG